MSSGKRSLGSHGVARSAGDEVSPCSAQPRLCSITHPRLLTHVHKGRGCPSPAAPGRSQLPSRLPVCPAVFPPPALPGPGVCSGPRIPTQRRPPSPMQISSSVSASPMQRNLNSLRESANLRLADERSAGRVGEGKCGRQPRNKPTDGMAQVVAPLPPGPACGRSSRG